MFTKSTLLALSALLHLAASAPLQPQKREIVWVTDVEPVYVTDIVTTVLWVTAGQEATAAASPASTPEATSEPQTHIHHHTTHTSHIRSTVTVQPASTAEPSSTTEAPATTSTEAAPAPTTPSSSSTTEAPAAPTTPSTTTAAPASSTTSTPASPSGSVTTGEITYYTPGLGSCGITSTSADLIVAMPVGVMDAAYSGGDPNDNPLCGRTITMQMGSASVVATITDTCPTCDDQHVDTSPAVFQTFGDLAEGVIQGVEWWLN